MNQTKQLAKFMGMLIALPCGVVLGINADLWMNKTLGDGKSLFPLPILLFPVAIITWILVYKIFVVLIEKYVSLENHKMLGIVIKVIFIILFLVLLAFVVVNGCRFFSLMMEI